MNAKKMTWEDLIKAASEIGEYNINEPGKSISIKVGEEILFVHCINHTVFSEDVTSNQTIQKLVLIAQKLNGRLRGDEMEPYREDGTSFTHPDDSNELAKHEGEIAKIVQHRKVIKMAKAVILVTILLIIALKCY